MVKSIHTSSQLINNNHQSLVSIASNQKNIITNDSVDAIYVPFKGRYGYINRVLEELKWYSNKLYVMPSSKADVENINWDINKSVVALHITDDFTKEYNSFFTSNSQFIGHTFHGWDLPMKRSFAVIHAVEKGYSKILLLDDDMFPLDSQIISEGAGCLKCYDVAGRFVENYPDTSVIGHLELRAGRGEN